MGVKEIKKGCIFWLEVEIKFFMEIFVNFFKFQVLEVKDDNFECIGEPRNAKCPKIQTPVDIQKLI